LGHIPFQLASSCTTTCSRLLFERFKSGGR
jgi:hypothetical protein